MSSTFFTKFGRPLKLAYLFFTLVTSAAALPGYCRSEGEAPIDNLIPPDYNPVMPPSTNGTPATVEFSTVVMNVRDINDQEFTLEMNMRIYWTDPRLHNLTGNSSFLVLAPSFVEKKIWKPDVYFDHVKRVTQAVLLSKPASIRLYHDGGIRYSSRVSITMACRMYYRYYPADTQHCHVDLKSYAYTTDLIVLEWHEGKRASLVENLILPNYGLKIHNQKPYTINTTSGEYSTIRFVIELRRKMTYHLLQTYLPSTLFLMVTWLSFVMPQDMGAVAICVTTLLTTTAMFAAVRQATPNVSYAKAIDIWMVVCIMFVFLSLAQQMITMRFRHTKIKVVRRKKELQRDKFRSMNELDIEQPEACTVEFHSGDGSEVTQTSESSTVTFEVPRKWKKANELRRKYRKKTIVRKPAPDEVEAAIVLNQFYKITGNRIRRTLGIINPLLFLLFNLFYWPWLLCQPDTESQYVW